MKPEELINPDSHIFEENDEWYYWDETETEQIGPFASYNDALVALAEYITYLESM